VPTIYSTKVSCSIANASIGSLSSREASSRDHGRAMSIMSGWLPSSILPPQTADRQIDYNSRTVRHAALFHVLSSLPNSMFRVCSSDTVVITIGKGYAYTPDISDRHDLHMLMPYLGMGGPKSLVPSCLLNAPSATRRVYPSSYIREDSGNLLLGTCWLAPMSW
jgi:hypothetical protein